MQLRKELLILVPLWGALASPATAQEQPIVGLIPKATKPMAMDGKLTGWDGAFVTPVHVAQRCSTAHMPAGRRLQFGQVTRLAARVRAL
jgi:hypothetical protein